jgi:hypothetical protein
VYGGQCCFARACGGSEDSGMVVGLKSSTRAVVVIPLSGAGAQVLR